MENQQPPLLYDLTRLTNLAANNMDFVKKMTRLFLTQSPIDLEELRNAADSGNIKKMKEVAHRMKPAIDNMGIATLSAVIREIELFAGTVITDKLRENLTLTEHTLNEVFRQLQEE